MSKGSCIVSNNGHWDQSFDVPHLCFSENQHIRSIYVFHEWFYTYFDKIIHNTNYWEMKVIFLLIAIFSVSSFQWSINTSTSKTLDLYVPEGSNFLWEQYRMLSRNCFFFLLPKCNRSYDIALLIKQNFTACIRQQLRTIFSTTRVNNKNIKIKKKTKVCLWSLV